MVRVRRPSRQPSREPAVGEPQSFARLRVMILCALMSGIAVVSSPCPAVAQTVEATASLQRYDGFIAEAAQRFGVPAAWIRAVLWQESRGDPRAVSPMGARGLMQIMPATWDGLRARHDLGNAPFDPRDNILAGTAYLRKMYDRYGEETAMLAAYDAGPARVDDWLRDGRPLPRETRAYLAVILPQISEGEAVDPHSDDPKAAPIFVPRSQRTNESATTVLPSTHATLNPTQSRPLQSPSPSARTPVSSPATNDPSTPSIFVDRSRRETSR